MSRIHDALKKAEQERAQGVLPERAGRTLGANLQRADHSTLSPPAAVAAEAMTVESKPQDEYSSQSLDAELLARCVQQAWNPDTKTMVFSDARKHLLGSEQFRSLRSHLYLIRKELPLKKLLITSPLPREGKTFVAGNLAHAFIQQPDRRVLLIDADLRISGLHQWLGAPSTPGLTDYLSGEMDELSVIHRGPLENLFFIPGGKAVTNPSELIGTGRLKVLLDRLAPAFDWIIMDSPPATLVSDAKLLADVCDGILMVVLACSTPYDLAQRACLEFRGRRILGAVLNRAEGGTIYDSYHYYDKARLGKEPGAEQSAKP